MNPDENVENPQSSTVRLMYAFLGRLIREGKGDHRIWFEDNVMCVSEDDAANPYKHLEKRKAKANA